MALEEQPVHQLMELLIKVLLVEPQILLFVVVVVVLVVTELVEPAVMPVMEELV